MFEPIPHKTATLPLPKSISCSLLRHSFLLIPLALALAWFALSQPAQGQDGDELNHNTAEGAFALHTYITTASAAFNNTAIGFNTLFSDTTGGNNTANGFDALFSNTTGSFNTATGYGALLSNTTADNNTATGFQALFANTTGNGNTATGVSALFSNTTGFQNMANGFNALFSNTTGVNNTATGFNTLFTNTTGTNNTTNGVDSLEFNTIGNNNTANGAFALNQNTTGGSNIALGVLAGANLTTGSNNIDIGNRGVAAESNHIRIGTVGTQNGTFIAGIHGVTVASAVGVVVDVNGHLGTVTSSARFKEAIKPMDKASEAILALKPVTFHYKPELDPDGIPQFGLVAEQVEKVNPDLVARDTEGKVNTVRYEAVNAMLLNEFLKEHSTVQELKSTAAKQEVTIVEVKSTVAKQEATIAQQRRDFESAALQQQKDFLATMAQQQKQIEALTANLQKVSDQMEMSRPVPQVVANNQ